MLACFGNSSDIILDIFTLNRPDDHCMCSFLFLQQKSLLISSINLLNFPSFRTSNILGVCFPSIHIWFPYNLARDFLQQQASNYFIQGSFLYVRNTYHLICSYNIYIYLVRPFTSCCAGQNKEEKRDRGRERERGM